MAPTSGIKITDDVRKTYSRVFMNSSKQEKLPYGVFMFNDNVSEVILDKDERYYNRQCSYSELLGLLPTDSPRYFVFDFCHLSKDKVKTSTAMLFSWFPSGCTMKQKFIVSTTFLSLAAALGVPKSKYMEGEETADIDEAAIFGNNKDWSPCPPESMVVPSGPVPIDIPEGYSPF